MKSTTAVILLPSEAVAAPAAVNRSGTVVNFSVSDTQPV